MIKDKKIFCFMFLLFVSCGKSKNHSKYLSQNPEERLEEKFSSPQDKLFWTSKLVRTLSLTPQLDNSQVRTLAQKPAAEILESLMQDDDALDVVFDFHRYMLHSPRDPIVHLFEKKKYYYDFRVLGSTAPLLAARGYRENTDLFEFLNTSLPIPYYMGGPNFEGPQSPEQPPTRDTERTRRSEVLTQARKLSSELIALSKAHETYEAYCARFKDNEELEIPDFADVARRFGLKEQMLNDVDAFALQPFTVSYCQAGDFFGSQSLPDTSQWKTEIEKEQKSFLNFINFLEQNIDRYDTLNSLSDISLLPINSFAETKFEHTLFDSNFWQNQTNSSTNYNRRRSAAVLKQFFCDDLTPIEIVKPDTHTGNKHASDPSCLSCHYKLDPMAGVFRQRGAAGIDFTQFNAFYFDDQKLLNATQKQDYLNSWKNADGTWNSGHVRPAQDSSLNTSLNSVAELLPYIKGSPSFTKCYVKRMAQYFLGEKQQFDPGWIDELSQNFEAIRIEKNSSYAFKNTLKSILTSNTFTTRNPDPKSCYDVSSKTNEKSSLECSVRFVIQESCASCHNSDSSLGGLNLAQFVKDEQGKGVFVHTDLRTGKLLSSQESMSRILERISSKEEDKRMPSGRFMEDTDRATLYLWVSEQLKKN